MLTLHRRHVDACEFRSKGWNYTLCECPIWCDGIRRKRFRRSLDTTNWDRAIARLENLKRGEPFDERVASPTIEPLLWRWAFSPGGC